MANGLGVIFQLRSAPVGSVAPFNAQTFGFWTGSAPAYVSSVTGSSVTLHPGFLGENLTVQNSADPSKAQGFFASFPEGSIEVIDRTFGFDSTFSGLLFSSAVKLIGATVWIFGYDSTSDTVTKLVQLGVFDYECTKDGVVNVQVRSLSALTGNQIYGVRSTTQLLTDPDDPSNPTDPLYLGSMPTAQYAGIAIGGVDVSLKTGEPLKACKFCFFKETTLKTGSITSASTVADVVGEAGDYFFDSQYGQAPDSLGYNSRLAFWTKTYAEAQRMIALFKQFANAGYKIIVSDGSWFLDLSVFGNADEVFGEFSVTRTRVSAVSTSDYPSLASDKHNEISVFLDTSISVLLGFREPYFPPEGLDPKSCAFYAVPSSISISAMQCVLEGFARNDRTIQIGGEYGVVDGISVYAPLVASADSFVAVAPIKDLRLTFDTDTTLTQVLGGIQDPDDYTINGILSGRGSISDIVTDPDNGYTAAHDPATAPISIKNTSKFAVLASLGVQINAKPGITKYDADIFTVESTLDAVFTSRATKSGNVTMTAVGPMQKRQQYGVTFSFSGGNAYTISKTASKSPLNPLWSSSFKSLEDLSGNITPYAYSGNYASLGIIDNVRLDVYECFVYGYSKFSFSDIYATVHPFWTKGNCAAIATNGASVVCNSGFGTISADGSISWQAITFPSKTGAEPLINSIGWDGVRWIAVGQESGALSTGWKSWFSGDGITWHGADISAGPTGEPTRFAQLNGVPLVVTKAGEIVHNLAMSTMAKPLFGMAYGLGSWIFCGGGGFAYSTSDFSSYSSIGPETADMYAATYWQGHFYLGGAGGEINRANAAEALSGVWHRYFLPDSADISDFAFNGTSLVCVTSYGVYATDTGTSWVRVTNDIPYTGGTAYGFGFGLAHTTVSGGDVWLMGANGQVFTSTTHDQGGTNPPDWIPWKGMTPGLGVQHIRNRYLGGGYEKWNPIRWTYGGGDPTGPNSRRYGFAIEPPTASVGEAPESLTAEKAIRKICDEQWLFSGEMPSLILDGSTDTIDIDLPEIAIGARQDMVTMFSFQYRPFGGRYLSTAYVQNVDKAYSAGNDSYYFGGWDDSGSTNGLQIWQACRDAYLKTGITLSLSKSFDTFHSADAIGDSFLLNDSDLGRRLDWLIDRPRYLTITVYGNDSQGAKAFSGCRYKPNATMMEARGYSIGRNGYGVIVDCNHNYITGEHSLTLALPPQAS